MDTSITSTRARLLKQLAQAPDGPSKPGNRWDPEEPGATILGVVTRFEWRPSRKGDGDFLICDIRELDSGEIFSLPASRTSLRSALTEANVAVGDTVGVMFRGTYSSSFGGQGYAYSVVKEEAEPEEVF